MDRKFRVGVIRVLTSDDPEFVSMHGRFIEEHYPGIECVSKCIPDQWEGIHSHELDTKRVSTNGVQRTVCP